MGIDTTVVDSLEECQKLVDCNWNGRAFLRIAVNDSDSKMPFSSKFGASREEIEEIAIGSGIQLSGISFHVGSGCANPLQYKEAIEFATGRGFDLLKKHGHYPNVIDIGGGFSSNPEEFSTTAKIIQTTVEKIPRTRVIIAEPGRFFAQPCQDLFVKVIAKKRGQNGKGWRYVIDESLYGHFSCIPFDHQNPPWFLVPQNDIEPTRKTDDSILFGRTCDSLDVIARGPMEELYIGDWLYFPLMGAYTSATASEFNGFPKPHVIEDKGNLLPDVKEAWNMVNEFYRTNSTLKYSNALPPIL
jgi:ornithine decarboxylase